MQTSLNVWRRSRSRFAISGNTDQLHNRLIISPTAGSAPAQCQSLLSGTCAAASDGSHDMSCYPVATRGVSLIALRDARHQAVPYITPSDMAGGPTGYTARGQEGTTLTDRGGVSCLLSPQSAPADHMTSLAQPSPARAPGNPPSNRFASSADTQHGDWVSLLQFHAASKPRRLGGTPCVRVTLRRVVTSTDTGYKSQTSDRPTLVVWR